MNVDALSREFCELAGICCPQCGGEGWLMYPAHAPDCDGECKNCPVPEPGPCDLCKGCYPDFTDAREVLKVMMEREDFHDFMGNIAMGLKVTPAGYEYSIPAKLMVNTTGLLLTEAIRWMEERK